MATVYLAHDLKHDRPVALKVLRPELGAVLGGERFLAEIKTTARLQHPHILPLLDSGEAAQLLYYVMPYVTGETLRARLERERQLGVDEVLRIVRALAGALDYAHGQGVIHRDLKPENILFQANEPVLADFGIALAVKSAGGERLTETGLSLGTPQYMSPEQAAGDRAVDARSDVYALGSVVYEMLAGEPPHTGPTTAAVLMKVMTQPPVPLGVVRPGVPAQVEAAVAQALAKAPADRFASAGAFAAALAAAPTPASVASERSIVVLPFDNLSPDPNDAYLADGLTEELISELSRLRVLKVISRNSAVAAKQRSRDTREVARLVGVRYVLEGTVRRAGNNLRITVQLLDGATGAQVWSDRYAGTMDDVFAMQTRLSHAIATALRTPLSADDVEPAASGPPRDARTFEAFLRARHEMWQYTPAALERAKAYVRRGLDLTPDDSELWATLAYIEWLAYGGAVEVNPDALRHFGECAERAVSLNPRSSLGWFARARFAINMGQARRAIEFSRRSIQLAPSGDCYAQLAFMLGYVGEEEEAVAAANEAVRIDPLAPVVLFWCAAAHHGLGRSEDALRIARGIDATNWLADFILGMIHVQRGERTEAVECFQRISVLPAGGGDFARLWLAALRQRPFASIAPATRAAWLTEIGLALYAGEAYALGGQREDALFWTRIAVLNGFCNSEFLERHSPNFAGLREDPEFRTLVVLADGQRSIWREPRLTDGEHPA